MKGDFIVRRNDDGSLFKIDLNFKTHHKIIRGFDVFIYDKKHRGLPHGWVCIDATTGACADNETLGHATKEEAFESAERQYERLGDEIIKAQQKAMKLGRESGIKYKHQGSLGDWI